MEDARGTVTTVLYGAGTHRRFTQDGPVLPDVWADYLTEPCKEIALLLEPWLRRTPFDIAERMREVMDDEVLDRHKVVYNRTTVLCTATLKELVTSIIPLTGWYSAFAEAAQRRGSTRKSRGAGFPPKLPTKEQLWEDVVRPKERTYPNSDLLGFVRIVGTIAYLDNGSVDKRPKREKDLEDACAKLQQSVDNPANTARDQIAEWALIGWNEGLNGKLPEPYRKSHEPPSSNKLIHSINRNRPARLAVAFSIKTVKGDAAARLFSVRARELTWAIVDCGIDASHPAFLDDPKRQEQGELTEKERLLYSRVKETYDFTELKELLRGSLPSHHRIRGRKLQKPDGNLLEIIQRVRRSQVIDWELLRPYLKVMHDDTYFENRPTDSHGTHVAGILAANWPREGDPIIGMCPDINLIDIRVCREDGSSDEFIIMSALQFLRHLNANAERPYVHGANLSLSIPHDVAVYACGQTPICLEAERTVNSGIVVVTAAGNFGYQRLLTKNNYTIEQYASTSITDPGNADSVITVGSTHRIEPHTYGVSYFSSRGPTGDGRIKPDLLAPGEKILAPALENKSVRLDGTSMAAPHVSGAAAMLMARNVELIGRPGRIKQILCSTATDLGRERYFQGHGLVDVLRALQSV